MHVIRKRKLTNISRHIPVYNYSVFVVFVFFLKSKIRKKTMYLRQNGAK